VHITSRISILDRGTTEKAAMLEPRMTLVEIRNYRINRRTKKFSVMARDLTMARAAMRWSS
jgi:hypothetical protein